MAEMTIVWDTPAKISFKKQIKYIARDSIQNAEQVRQDILSVIDLIPVNPEKFPPDKFKTNNDGLFRAFEKHNIRVAYFIGVHQIRILRIRHIKQEPKPY
jgi:plasmid stabilization system protein ParE